MDVQEKKVIRWKRDLLSANLTWDEATIRKLKSYDLIWDSLISEIEETEMKNCEKVWKYLEHLMRAKLDRNVFNVLCEFLDEENPWISSELRVELSLERGQLKIDDYIKNEASTLVHRFFGTTKRLSEAEKRQLEELLAIRTQCTKNIWIKNVEQTKQALSEQVAMAKNKDAVLKGLIRKIQIFINQSRITNSRSSRGSFETEDGNLDEANLRWPEEESGKGLIRKMESSVDKLLEYSSICSEKLELLREEKLRVYDILEHSGRQTQDETFSRSNGNARLDKDIIKVVKSFTERLNDSSRITDDSEKKLREANKQIHELKNNYDHELQERDRNIRYLAGSLEKCEKESNERKEELENLKNKMEQAKSKNAELEEQLKYWERYRHYGYWYSRHDENYLSKSMKDLNMEKKSSPTTAIPRSKKLLTSRQNTQSRKSAERKSVTSSNSVN